MARSSAGPHPRCASSTRGQKKNSHMLTHPTQERLTVLGLTGMAKALEEQRRQPDVAALPFEERLALLVDREAIERENKRLVSRLKFAGLRQNAAIEDLDTKAVRGLDKALFARLAAGDWIARRENSDHPRQNRARQKLACLRTRPQGLPRRSLSTLPSRPPPVRCARARTRRRPPRPAAQDHRAGRTPHPRRLGACQRNRRTGARCARDSRRPAGARFNHYYQPGRCEALARHDRQSDRCRRHPRPTRAQRSSPQSRRRKPT